MNPYESLLARVSQVRRRWRAQVLVKGISLFVASAIALLVLGVWGADLFGFRPAAVWVLRVVTGGAVLFVAWRFLYEPLSARVSDIQIAQLIEESYPHLEDRLVTAVEHGQRDAASSSMIDLLIRDALEKTSRVELSVFLNRRRIACFGVLGGAACLALLALLAWGPSFFPYGFSHLYAPWTEASLGSAMRIQIEPGDVEIAKGSDQQVQAQLIGFESPEVQMFSQPEGSGVWNAVAMEPDPRGSGYRYLLVDIGTSLRYYVEARGVRSQIHSMRVTDLARVDRIGLTYNFPVYTGMEPQTVEDEGDITALRGTKIGLRIHLSSPAQSARLFFDDRSTLDLAPSGPQDYSGSFELRRSGSYGIQVAERNGKSHAGSPEYGMEALEDSLPEVTITRPMRDVRATSVEEVFAEIKTEDDFGTGRLELRYAVNGGPEKTVRLYSGMPPAPSVTRSHTFFLEDFGLQPGDVVSYYGTAWDNNNVTGPGKASSDIYFIEVRPFEQKYVQNQQGGGQPGNGGEAQEALSQQQKEIVSATFKLIREKNRMPAKEFVDGVKALALVQSRLQAQTQGLVDRLQRRGAVQVDESFRKLSEYLNNAIGEMSKAAVNLGAQKPDSALPQEQRSLQQLMRAESLFREIQVSFAAQGGAGSGSQANAEDLADLFELELNKLKNQYETVQRGEKQSRDQKVDEALQRLKELAKRQQQLNERNRMLAQRGGSPSSSGGGQGQQQLLEQAEQLRRQLQRLSRERSSPELSEAGRQIERAVEEMKKALKGSQRGNDAEASAQGMRALQQLNDATRRLARNQESGLSRGLDQTVDESRKLVEEQARIQEGLDRLAKEEPRSASADEIDRQGEELVSRKTVLADRLRNLQDRIQDLSGQARKTRKETSGKLADAAGGIRERRLPERIEGGNAMIRNGYYEAQKPREDFIRDGLEELAGQLESARNSLGKSSEGNLEEAVGRARQLAEGLESMRQRMGSMQRGQQGQGEAQNQTGRQSAGSRDAPGSRGQNPADSEGGTPNADADVRGLSGDAIGLPMGIGTRGDEAARQLGREFEQRLADAQELRRLLDRNSTQMENLEKVIESLRRAGDYQGYRNPAQIESLRAAIDFMRKVELDLARDLDRLSRNEEYFFSGDNETPAGYRKLVDEYYKSIARSK
jgi:hypothetical protein